MKTIATILIAGVLLAGSLEAQAQDHRIAVTIQAHETVFASEEFKPFARFWAKRKAKIEARRERQRISAQNTIILRDYIVEAPEQRPEAIVRPLYRDDTGYRVKAPQIAPKEAKPAPKKQDTPDSRPETAKYPDKPTTPVPGTQAVAPKIDQPDESFFRPKELRKVDRIDQPEAPRT